MERIPMASKAKTAKICITELNNNLKLHCFKKCER